jgi:hypothetical protein
MPQGYAIIATSETNLRQKKVDLNDSTPITDSQYAQRLAESYAADLNRLGMANCTNWVGSIEWTHTGIETIEGFQGFAQVGSGSQH